MIIKWNDVITASSGRSKKSKAQMGFEPTTLRDLVRYFYPCATGDSVARVWFFVRWIRILGIKCLPLRKQSFREEPIQLRSTSLEFFLFQFVWWAVVFISGYWKSWEATFTFNAPIKFTSPSGRWREQIARQSSRAMENQASSQQLTRNTQEVGLN